MATVKVTTVGNSAGIVMPKKLLRRLRIRKGDKLYVVENPAGFELTPYKEDKYRTFLRLGAGELVEDDFVDRIRTHLVEIER